MAENRNAGYDTLYVYPQFTRCYVGGVA